VLDVLPTATWWSRVATAPVLRMTADYQYTVLNAAHMQSGAAQPSLPGLRETSSGQLSTNLAEGHDMKIVIIGGTGLIGSKLAKLLQAQGHEVVAASPATGVDTITRKGLPEALAGAQVVVDVANSPSFEDQAVLAFFETSGRNLLAAEQAAGVKHHVALSVVGTDRNPESGYLRAKLAQENLIEASGLPYTILRSTQFFEFIKGIIEAGAAGGTVRLSPALFQPVAADDVAAVLADLAVTPPVNGIIEVAGPEPLPLDQLARKYLAATSDKRTVIADIHARYFGAELNDRSLTPGDNPMLGPTHLEDWLNHASRVGLRPG
jgi:uncharacterized protein YbjT (DUF2867 family)